MSHTAHRIWWTKGWSKWAQFRRDGVESCVLKMLLLSAATNAESEDLPRGQALRPKCGIMRRRDTPLSAEQRPNISARDSSSTAEEGKPDTVTVARSKTTGPAARKTWQRTCGPRFRARLQYGADRFYFGVLLQDLVPHLTAPAGLLKPAKGQRSVKDVVAIDPHGACAKLRR